MHAKLRLLVFASTIATFVLSACGGGGGASAAPPKATPPPSAKGTPSAKIYAPKTASSYSMVTLDGSLSRETTASVTLSSYSWTQTGGPSVQLTGANTETTTFTAPQVTTASAVSFSLTVTDSAGVSASASASIKVSPASSTATIVKFISLTFLTPVKGDPHVDAVPATSAPVAGASAMIQVSLSGYVQSPTFTLVDSNGVSLATAQLSLSGSSSAQPLDFVGTVTIPSVPFAVSASGTTADGQSFSVKSASFTPQTFTAGFVPARALLKKGASFTSQLQLYNGGPSGSFLLLYLDSSGLLGTTPPPQSMQINQGQTISIPVTVTMPSTLSHTFAPQLIAALVDSNDPSHANGAELTALLSGAP